MLNNFEMSKQSPGPIPWSTEDQQLLSLGKNYLKKAANSAKQFTGDGMIAPIIDLEQHLKPHELAAVDAACQLDSTILMHDGSSCIEERPSKELLDAIKWAKEEEPISVISQPSQHPPVEPVSSLSTVHSSSAENPVVGNQLIDNFCKRLLIQNSEPALMSQSPSNDLYKPQINGYSQVSPFPQSTLQQEGMSHYQLAKRLLEKIPLKRYRGSIYRFNGIIHVKQTDDDLKALVLTVLEPEISHKGHASVLRGVVEFIKAMEELNASPITEPRFLCMRNGILDLESNTLMPHSATYFFTSYINVDFIPGPLWACPEFDRFLFVTFGGSAVLTQRFWETLGYLLTMDMNGKIFVIFQGVGNSGKSLLGRFITSLFNEGAVSNISIFQLEERFACSGLVEKRLNSSMDLPNTRLSRKAVGNIKMLTGDDTISVEEKFKNAISYHSQCKMIFSSNHPLRLAEPDEAFAARVLKIPFYYQVPKESQDHRLQEKFEIEKSAVVMRSLYAYRGLVANGYRFAGHDVPELQMDFQPSVVNYEETMLRFVSSCCELTGPELYTDIAFLHERYCAFATAENLPSLYDRVQFSRQLVNMFPSLSHVKKRIFASEGQGRIPRNCCSGIVLKQSVG